MNLRRRLSGYFSSVGVSAVPLLFVLHRIASFFFFCIVPKAEPPGGGGREGGRKKKIMIKRANLISPFPNSI